MKCIIALFVFLFGVQTTSMAQEQTALEIDTIAIVARKNVGKSNKIWMNEEIDFSTSTDISELINESNALFVKSYGLGSIATSSIRGASSSQSSIYWNGIQIQNAMIGLIDISQIPSFLFDEIELTLGGDGALKGSGAIGGTIDLENNPKVNPGLSLSGKSIFRSFGGLEEQFGLSWSSDKLTIRTKLYLSQAENNFNYLIEKGFPEKEQSNNRLFRRGAMQELFYYPFHNHTFSLKWWSQYQEKEIPPHIDQSFSTASQEDGFNRLLAGWSYRVNNSILKLDAAFFDEYIDYHADENSNSLSNFKTLSLKGAYSRGLGRYVSLDAELSYKNSTGEISFYASKKVQTRKALFFSARYKKEKLLVQLSSRQAQIDENWVPFIPSLGIEYECFVNFKLLARAGRVFRAPSLNDLYWIPGGNELLRPELGWSQELGFTHKLNTSLGTLSYSSNYYNREISDWIIWLRVINDPSFTAFNVGKVHSRGLETKLGFESAQKRLNWDVQFNYNYTLSTYSQLDVSFTSPQLKIGDQLLYTPKHTVGMRLALSFRNFRAAYHHQMIGESHGIVHDLESFHLGNISLSQRLDLKALQSTLHIKLNNIYNTDYMVIDRRPMPGINYSFGLTIKY